MKKLCQIILLFSFAVIVEIRRFGFPQRMQLKSVIIIGGGISGLLTAIQLGRAGIACTLIEKKIYPFHRVCGEYISNEAVPFLKSLDLYPESLVPARISRLQLSAPNGHSAIIPLPLGGFGISRHSFDLFLYQQAKNAGVIFLLGIQADEVQFQNNQFRVRTGERVLTADLVIGSFGKRSSMDVSLGRPFVKKRSPYFAVKYHVRTERPPDLISLHNFRNGYCGVSAVENGITNVCYLSHRQNMKAFGSLRAMEEAVLFRNPFLRSLFVNAEFLLEKPEAIGEISFQTKGPVENHVLMTGDAAGMIAPLSGNGMAIAIHTSKLLSSLVKRYCTDPGYRLSLLESDYSDAWKRLFQKRLWFGRQIQHFFGSEWTSSSLVLLARLPGPAANWIVRKTHGRPF